MVFNRGFIGFYSVLIGFSSMSMLFIGFSLFLMVFNDFDGFRLKTSTTNFNNSLHWINSDVPLTKRFNHPFGQSISTPTLGCNPDRSRLGKNWERIGKGLEKDCKRIVAGLGKDWKGFDWEKVEKGLDKDWKGLEKGWKGLKDNQQLASATTCQQPGSTTRFNNPCQQPFQQPVRKRATQHCLLV